MPRFHNPYTFIPCPERNLQHPFAGDHDPSRPQFQEDHSRYWPSRFTGTIPIEMEVVTPLLLPRTPEVSNDHGHRVYDSLDHVPVTSLKGMLRSAVEILTNSRFGVFGPEHDHPLFWRRQASARVVPGRVHRAEDGSWTVELFRGTATIGPGGEPNGPLYAAWIDAYPTPRWSGNVTTLPATGTRVHAALVECGHFNVSKGKPERWTFWLVVGMWDHPPTVDELKAVIGELQDPPNGRQRWFYRTKKPQDPQDLRVVEGYVVVSGKIAQNKHCERLFFDASPLSVPLDDKVRASYDLLVKHYRDIHRDESVRPKTPYGQHILTGAPLADGDFLYVETTCDNNSLSVKKLFPVQISRDFHAVPPAVCLSPSLRPATSMDQLSPADRLFGWVSSRGHGAWRGKVRIEWAGWNEQPGHEVVERFIENEHAQTLPLSILSSPKPSYGRFYVGDGQGNPQADGIPKDDTGYQVAKKLRGRKIYWNHKRIAGNAQYWGRPWQDRTETCVAGFYQEYRQPNAGGPRSNQNVSFTGWIRPGSVARFRLRVENLTAEELGLLMYLLDLPEGVTLALGHGKPLGFGRVRLRRSSTESVQVAANDMWRDLYWSDLTTNNTEDQSFWLSDDEIKHFVQTFKSAMVEAYGQPGNTFEDLPFVKAFLHVSRGDNLPVHYPRKTQPRVVNGAVVPSYQWFVANDRLSDGHCPGKTLSLPWEDHGLPYNPSEE